MSVNAPASVRPGIPVSPTAPLPVPLAPAALNVNEPAPPESVTAAPPAAADAWSPVTATASTSFDGSASPPSPALSANVPLTAPASPMPSVAVPENEVAFAGNASTTVPLPVGTAIGAADRSPSVFLAARQPVAVKVKPVTPASATSPVARNASAAEPPAGLRAAKPSSALAIVAWTPAASPRRTVAPAAPTRTSLSVALSVAVMAMLAALTATKPVTVSATVSAVSAQVPRSAAWPLSEYVPDSAPVVPPMSPPNEELGALTVIEPVNLAFVPVPVITTSAKLRVTPASVTAPPPRLTAFGAAGVCVSTSTLSLSPGSRLSENVPPIGSNDPSWKVALPESDARSAAKSRTTSSPPVATVIGALERSPSSFSLPVQPLPVSEMPVIPVSATSPVIWRATFGSASAGALRDARPNVASLTVAAGPVALPSVAVTPVAPIRTSNWLSESCASSTAVAASTETNPLACSSRSASVSENLPRSAFWPVSA